MNKKYIGLLGLCLMMFIVTLDSTITNISLPTITNYFDSNVQDSNWVSTIYVLTLSVLIIPASKFGDIFGRKKVTIFGLIIFGVASFLCGVSQSLFMLISMRLLQGIGGAIITPLVVPLSVDIFGRDKANQAVGIVGASAALSAAVGPPIGGIIIDKASWEWIFFINIPFVIVATIILIVIFSESYDTTITKKVDIGGLISLIISLSTLTFSLIKGYEFGWSSIPIVFCLVVFVASGIIFIIIENKIPYPLIDLELFKETTFTVSACIYLLCGFLIVSPTLIFNFYLENVRNYTTLDSAFIIMWVSIAVVIAMPIGSKLADFIGFSPVILVGSLLMALGTSLLCTLDNETSKQTMIIYMVIIGLGFGLACLSLISSVKNIPTEKAGIASGIVNSFRQIGTCLGIAVLVGVMSSNIDTARQSIVEDTNHAILTHNIPGSISTVIKKDVHELVYSDNKKENISKIERDVNLAIKEDTVSQRPKNGHLLSLYSALNLLEKQFTPTDNSLYMSYNKLTQSQQNLIRKLLNSIPTGISESNSEIQKITQIEQTISDGQDKLGNELSQRGKLYAIISSLKIGISKIDLSQRLKLVSNDIKNSKTDRLTQSFTQTFVIATTILIFSIPLSIFSDKNTLSEKFKRVRF